MPNSRPRPWLLAAACLFGSLVLPTLAQTQPGAPAAAPVAAPRTAPPADPPATVRLVDVPALLQRGGHVLVMRHERTELDARADDYSRPTHDCLAQRNLSVAGVAGAAETAEAIRRLQIPLARILSSPLCRAMETARPFGRVEPEARLMHPVPDAAGAFQRSEADTLDLAEGLDTSGGTVLLVTHQPNLRAFGIRLAEGEMAVLVRTGPRQWRLVARLHGSDWSSLARTVRP
jgi:phosphohistidine phosphatase SixA